MESMEGSVKGEMNQKISDSKPLHIGKPKWLKTQLPSGEKYFKIREDLRTRRLATVCQEAKCPNIGKCWNDETATIMILGDTCTRACRFCNVKTGDPQGWLDDSEPEHVAQTCYESGLKYVVLTMVDRDDLSDGGAGHVVKVVKAIKAVDANMKVELLAGDFRGDFQALYNILLSGVDVYAHNLETIERLTPKVRDARASYSQSLQVLAEAKNFIDSNSSLSGRVFTKSGLMLGLGENSDEIITTLKDMRATGVSFVTIGQYMRPSKKHLSVKRWVPPEEFDLLSKEALSLGFRSVAAAPLVRSSFRAREFYEAAVDC
ncbi:MAG: lipoyl synthase [Bdellovibrionota bacterium]